MGNRKLPKNLILLIILFLMLAFIYYLFKLMVKGADVQNVFW